MDRSHGGLHSTSRILRPEKEYPIFVHVHTGILLWIACDGSSRHMQRVAEEGQPVVLCDVGVDTHNSLDTRTSQSLLESHRAAVTLQGETRRGRPMYPR